MLFAKDRRMLVEVLLPGRPDAREDIPNCDGIVLKPGSFSGGHGA